MYLAGYELHWQDLCVGCFGVFCWFVLLLLFWFFFFLNMYDVWDLREMWACRPAVTLCYQKPAWHVSVKQMENPTLNCFDLHRSVLLLGPPPPKKNCLCLGSTHAELRRLFTNRETYCIWAALPMWTAETGIGKIWPCISSALSSELLGKEERRQIQFSFGTLTCWFTFAGIVCVIMEAKDDYLSCMCPGPLNSQSSLSSLVLKLFYHKEIGKMRQLHLNSYQYLAIQNCNEHWVH